MKILRIALYAVFILFVGSCQIRDLKERVSELERQLNAKDSVVYNDLNITSQAAMDIFKGQGIKVVLGTVRIENCNDLTPLLGLRSVQGLAVDGSRLDSFEGLDSLTSAEFIDLWRLNSGTDFSALNKIEFSTRIYLDGEVSSTGDMFTSLKYLESLEIYSNQADVNVSGFNDVENIQYFNIYTDVYDGRESNISISGFESVTEINWLSIIGSNLEINAFDRLTELEALDIYAAEQASGLNSVRRINGYLSLGVPLSDDFLSSLTTVRDLSLSSYTGTSTVTSLAYFNIDRLTGIKGFNVYGLTSLQDFDGVDFSSMSLENIGVFDCPQLADLSGLSTYSGTLNYASFGNLNITSLNGLQNITKFQSLDISNCPRLESLDSLSNLQTAFNNLGLYNNGIKSLDGLEGVSRIDYLFIDSNSQLEDWCAIKDIFDAIPIGNRYINGNKVNPANSEDIIGCD